MLRVVKDAAAAGGTERVLPIGQFGDRGLMPRIDLDDSEPCRNWPLAAAGDRALISAFRMGLERPAVFYCPRRKPGPREPRDRPCGADTMRRTGRGLLDGRRDCGSGLTSAHRSPLKRKTAEGRSFAVRLRRSSRSDDRDRCAAAAPEAGVAQAGDARQHHRPGRRLRNPSA